MLKKNAKRVPITVRIDEELESVLNYVSENLLFDKRGNIIRNYLRLADVLGIRNDGTITGYNNRLLMVMKHETLQNILTSVDPELQASIGDSMALYINDICRIKGNSALEYKLDLSNKMGWFNPTIDSEMNVQIPYEFGPENYVKSFCYRLTNEKRMEARFLTDRLTSDKAKKENERIFGKGDTATSAHYSFKFMHLREED